MNIFKLPVTGLFRKKERAGDLEFLFDPGLKSRSESEKTPENPERKHSRPPEETSENIPEKYNQVKFEAQNPSGSPGNAAMPVFQPDLPGTEQISDIQDVPQENSRMPGAAAENIPEKYGNVRFETENFSGNPVAAAMPVFHDDGSGAELGTIAACSLKQLRILRKTCDLLRNISSEKYYN